LHEHYNLQFLDLKETGLVKVKFRVPKENYEFVAPSAVRSVDGVSTAKPKAKAPPKAKPKPKEEDK